MGLPVTMAKESFLSGGRVGVSWEDEGGWEPPHPTHRGSLHEGEADRQESRDM